MRLLGPLELWVSAQPASLTRKKTRALLAVLALSANRAVSTDSLIGQLWDQRLADPHGSLQNLISELRKVVGHRRIELFGGGYRLRLDSSELDVSRFESLAREGRDALRGGENARAADTLRSAIDLWRGQALADFLYDEFAQDHVRRLDEERLTCLAERIEADLLLGRHDDVIAELRDLVASHPLREPFIAQLMLAFYRCGRQAEALEACRDLRRRLVEGQGSDPSSEVQRLERAILDHDPALDAPPRDALGVGLRRRPGGGLAAKGGLPTELTSFIGRRRERAEVAACLRSARLVTLVGAGGSGKTRLAISVAAGLLETFADGVCFVDLAPLSPADSIVLTVAKAMGIRADVGRDTEQGLAAACRDRHLLLLLDNCEHVIDHAATLVDALLRTCPDIVVMATSRKTLRIDCEHVYGVPTFDVADDDQLDVEALLASDAVRLFAERVQRHARADVFDLDTARAATRICRRLDGLPLAIELAAARLRSMSIRQLEAHLDSRFSLLVDGSRTAPERQQTLRAAIDWSWELLSDREQSVLARVSVFAGSWSIDAAESVASGQGIERVDVLPLLSSLVDQSLVRFDGAKADRYRLHETVRAYARAKLADSGEVARTSMRHLDHYLELAETAAPHLTSHGQLEWLASLELEHDNLRVALSVGVTGAPLRALQLCLALQCFWRFSGPADEGVEPLARLLKTSSQIPPAQRGEALAALSALLIEVGEVAQAWDRAAEAVEIARAERDHSVEGRALSVMAFAAFRQGKNDDAIALSDRAVELARWCNDVDLLSNSLNTRGILAACTAGGDIDSAFASLREAYDLCVASGHAVRLGAVLNNLGYAALSCGARTLARGYLNEALSKADLDPRSANAVENMAFLEFLDGDRQAARELFVNAFWTARREGDENQLAYALLGFALTSESPEVSVRIHAAADVIIRERGEAYEAVEAEVRASDHERLRTLLGSERFEALYETGSSLGRDEVMTLALG